MWPCGSGGGAGPAPPFGPRVLPSAMRKPWLGSLSTTGTGHVFYTRAFYNISQQDVACCNLTALSV